MFPRGVAKTDMTIKPKAANLKKRDDQPRAAYARFVDQILDWTRTDLSRPAYFENVCRLMTTTARCDFVEIRVVDHDQAIRSWLAKDDEHAALALLPCARDENGSRMAVLTQDIPLLIDVVRGRFDPSSPIFTARGALRVDAKTRDDAWLPEGDRRRLLQTHDPDREWSAAVLCPMALDGKHLGLLRVMWGERPEDFSGVVEFIEEIAATLARCLGQRRGVVALRERVKELICLYAISRLIEERDLTIGDVMRQVVDLLPPAWQYPEITTARIVIDDAPYLSAPFREGPQVLRSDIVAAGRKRGRVEVHYTRECPNLDEGPFLHEERHLLDAIARQLGLVVEERHVRAERTSLHDQLLHADRLATIGQLAAGVAHELNEPLGNILGFAQLLQKTPGLPSGASADVEKIVKAALHTREVVRKLLIFARKAPINRVPTSLNAAVEEALFFLEGRCAREGVAVVKKLTADLPDVLADSAQLRQIVVNLVVNAVQAMPGGGTVFVESRRHDDDVVLSVQDTGAGMSDEALARIFEPFFTTKKQDEGTGLGLPVVHGIVQSHDGTIRVESQEGAGTRFEVFLPAERRSKRRNGS